MHRVKGLEFDRVIIASMNEGVVPIDLSSENDDVSLQHEAAIRERSLVYVAATRAKKAVNIFSYGKKSKLIDKKTEV